MLRLNSKIDCTMGEWFARLQTLPACEQQAIREAIKCGIRHDTVAEIPDALFVRGPGSRGTLGAVASDADL